LRAPRDALLVGGECEHRVLPLCVLRYMYVLR
jgi:hypothetical protein